MATEMQQASVSLGNLDALGPLGQPAWAVQMQQDMLIAQQDMGNAQQEMRNAQQDTRWDTYILQVQVHNTELTLSIQNAAAFAKAFNASAVYPDDILQPIPLPSVPIPVPVRPMHPMAGAPQHLPPVFNPVVGPPVVPPQFPATVDDLRNLTGPVLVALLGAYGVPFGGQWNVERKRRAFADFIGTRHVVKLE